MVLQLHRHALLVALTPLVLACGDDGRADTTAGVSASTPITLTGSSDPSTTAGTTDTGSASATGTSDTGGCPEAKACGDTCCGESEQCVAGECVPLCANGKPPCGDAQVCCETGEVCYVGQCLVPGDPCQSAGCASKVGTDCPEGQICDAQLEKCMPDVADGTCAFQPEVGVFDPVPRFTWGLRKQRACADGCQKEEVCEADVCKPTWNHVDIADDDNPDFRQVVMSPMIADLDGDCVPEIIFNSYKGQGYTTNGILRAIRGDTGEKVFTLADADWRTDPGSHPAIGDLDGDGSPEIIVPGEGSRLYAIAGDGTPLWKSDAYGFGGKSGSPSLADFDGQGAIEIAFGRAVFDAAGVIAWEAPNGATGANGSVGPLSCVADLDGDERPELIAGATVYTFTGTVGVDFQGQSLWTGMPADGYCGVADFDLDGVPEVALVNSGDIVVFDGLTGAVLASVTIPGGGAGGPPNIADFDGDGRPDIGTAGGNSYVVVQYQGPGMMSELWQADTKDGSSQRTGSSVFDFDGDGRSEVIYGDEWHLRIYPGTEPDCAMNGPLCDGLMTDEEILFIDINSSRTRSEFPVVADVDGDFKAEIIVSTNNESDQGKIGDAGIEVFEDRLDNWVGTLPIWNQHTYHVTNVRADASIPSPEPPNWSTPQADPYNSYRRNTQGDLAENCAPDLVPADLFVESFDCVMVEMSVRVVNQGCLGVGPGVKVAFYDVEDGLLGVVETTQAIPAGGSQTVALATQVEPNPPLEIYAVVDDDGAGAGAFNECREDNNASEPLETCTIEG